MRVVGRVEIDDVPSPASQELRRIQHEALSGSRPVDEHGKLELHGREDPRQRIPAVTAETLVVGLENAGGVCVCGRLYQEERNEERLLSRLRALPVDIDGRIPRFNLIAHTVNEDGVLPRVEETLNAIVSLRGARRCVVPANVAVVTIHPVERPAREVLPRVPQRMQGVEPAEDCIDPTSIPKETVQLDAVETHKG